MLQKLYQDYNEKSFNSWQIGQGSQIQLNLHQRLHFGTLLVSSLFLEFCIGAYFIFCHFCFSKEQKIKPSTKRKTGCGIQAEEEAICLRDVKCLPKTSWTNLKEEGITQGIAEAEDEVLLGVFRHGLHDAVLHPDRMLGDAVVVYSRSAIALVEKERTPWGKRTGVRMSVWCLWKKNVCSRNYGVWPVTRKRLEIEVCEI